ncbi:hypothetical protein [Paenibacillus sp. FSL K6-2524]|uniref:hypothetical protein n=1 Tax=Paenibacillus sp. FSL K6-2524 TaxID=2954516 RepID=UPI0030F58711
MQIDILKSNDFMKPNVKIIEEFTGYDGYIHLLLSHESDSKINQYEHSHLVEEHLLSLYHKPTPKTLKKDFENYIEALFDFQHYEENQRTVLIFEFEQLSLKDNFVLPCFIMVRTKGTLR